MAMASIWEGSPPCSTNALAKAPRSPALYHEKQSGVLGIQDVGHVAMPAPGAGLIDSNADYGAPVTQSVRLLDVMDQYSPQTGIVFVEQIGHGIDGHLSA